MSTAFLNKVYDVYENRDYFGIGCDNLNPVREVKSSQAEVISEDQVLNAVKARLDKVKKTVNKLKLDIEDAIDPSEEVIQMDPRGDKLANSAVISPKEAMVRTKMGTPVDAATIFGDVPGDSVDGSEIDALEKEIQKQIINIMAFAGMSTDESFDNVSSPFTIDCDGVATEITGEDDDDDDDKSDDKKSGNEDSDDRDDDTGDDDDSDDDEEEDAESKQDEKDDEEEQEAEEAILQCALKELAFLKIILMILKIVKVLRRICAYVISTVYIVMDIVQLAAGAWLNPTNISKIANKIIQRVLAAAVMAIFQIIQKLWNMLNLQCISDLTQDLIDQIKEALSMLEELKSLCDPNSISFDPSEIMQTLISTIEKAAADVANQAQNFDLKEQGQAIVDQLKDTGGSMAEAVKKAAVGQALKAYNESKQMFDRAKALLGLGGNKTAKDISAAAARLGLSGMESK